MSHNKPSRRPPPLVPRAPVPAPPRIPGERPSFFAERVQTINPHVPVPMDELEKVLMALSSRQDLSPEVRVAVTTLTEKLRAAQQKLSRAPRTQKR